MGSFAQWAVDNIHVVVFIIIGARCTITHDQRSPENGVVPSLQNNGWDHDRSAGRVPNYCLLVLVVQNILVEGRCNNAVPFFDWRHAIYTLHRR